MSEFEHLSPEVVPVLQQAKAERVEFCLKDRWIGYTRAMAILDQLDDLVNYPRSLRMPNLLIVGRSGNGKSSLLEHFCHRHPVQVAADGSPNMPILYIEMPETPSEGEFWSLILWTLLISHREKDPASIKKRQARSSIQYARVRVLVIDEFHNLTNAGRKAGDLLAAIRGLSNALKLCVVASGTEKAINALNSDPQMKSRFQPALLDRWMLNTEYLRMLVSYERLLPLAKPSGLATRPLAPKIYDMGGGTIGDTIKVLKAAAVKAIESGEERITRELLDSLDWSGAEDWVAISRAV